jgi:hypothetical protein
VLAKQRATRPRFFARPQLGWWTAKVAMTQAPVFFATFATFANIAAYTVT